MTALFSDSIAIRTFRRDTADAVVEIVREAEEYGIQDELVYQFHDWELNPNLEDPERNIGTYPSVCKFTL